MRSGAQDFSGSGCCHRPPQPGRGICSRLKVFREDKNQQRPQAHGQNGRGDSGHRGMQRGPSGTKRAPSGCRGLEGYGR